MSNQKLAEELHKPFIGKLEKRTAYLSFMGNFWTVDLADMQLIGKCNKGIWFLLCVIDTFRKYTFIILLKEKKSITITNDFQKN